MAQWTNGTNINNTNTGNVGIGTSSPATLLEVSGGSAAGITTLSGGNAGGDSVGALSFNRIGSGELGRIEVRRIAANDQGFLSFFTKTTGNSASERMRIDQNGNVGIGTTNPSRAMVQVNRSAGAVPAIEINLNAADTGMYFDVASGYSVIESIQPGVGFTTRPLSLMPNGGKVGIGKTNPTVTLDVVGDIKASGTIFAKYQDVAEWVPSSEKLAAGTVVVLDSTKSNQVIASGSAYDTRVAGVISAQPGITLGEKSDDKVLVATTGRVLVKVDASRGPIAIGDLLVTSDVPGFAMKSEAVNLGGVKIHRPGTIIGKALELLEKGKGEILALLSLQ
jgi:hypothetical protein